MSFQNREWRSAKPESCICQKTNKLWAQQASQLQLEDLEDSLDKASTHHTSTQLNKTSKISRQ